MRDLLISLGIAAAITLGLLLFMVALTVALTAAPEAVMLLFLFAVLTLAVHAFQHTKIDDDEWPHV